MSMAWSDTDLELARLRGDASTDELAGRVLGGQDPHAGDTRLGYNHLLDLADRLLEEPELYLVPTSSLRQGLAGVDPALADYFDPRPVPAWVDEQLLDQAGAVWDEHSVAIICALYAASLPNCYLMAKGIPTLYATRKLGEGRFIFQRIYETGLMLDAAMRPDGLKIVRDVPIGDLRQQLASECQRRQPYADWQWRGEALAPSAGNAKLEQATVAAAVRNQLQAAPRWAWGAGVIATLKVRFLHASMRYYLINPPPGRSTEPTTSGEALLSSAGTAYDAKVFGVPLNQEDLAFTLLSFGYVLPEALARWGIVLSPAEREAFWHRWRLIGHILGVEEGLVPVDYAGAGVLYRRILARQKGPSPMGVELTGALMGFLGSYLPPNLRRDLPAMLIGSQLGDDATMLLPATQPAPPRLLSVIYHWLVVPALKLVNRMRRTALADLPIGIGWLNRIMHHAGQALIDSWRDAYDRKPFYVPDSVAGGWHRLRGVDPAYLDKLMHWRSSLFMTCLAGVAGMITGTLLWIPALILLPFSDGLSSFVFGLGAMCWLAAILLLSLYLPYLVTIRPKRADNKAVLHQPAAPAAMARAP